MNIKYGIQLTLVFWMLIFNNNTFGMADECKIEKIIIEKLEALSGCKVEIQIEKTNKVSLSEGDFKDSVPKIMPSDLEALVNAKICGNKDKYYFWLRLKNDKYEVISYASFSQPD